MDEIDFNTTCVVQLVIDSHDKSTSLFTYKRPNSLSTHELIKDAMDVFDKKWSEHENWLFMTSVLIARTEEEFYDLCTENDLPEPTIDE